MASAVSFVDIRAQQAATRGVEHLRDDARPLPNSGTIMLKFGGPTLG